MEDVWIHKTWRHIITGFSTLAAGIDLSICKRKVTCYKGPHCIEFAHMTFRFTPQYSVSHFPHVMTNTWMFIADSIYDISNSIHVWTIKQCKLSACADNLRFAVCVCVCERLLILFLFPVLVECRVNDLPESKTKRQLPLRNLLWWKITTCWSAVIYFNYLGRNCAAEGRLLPWWLNLFRRVF